MPVRTNPFLRVVPDRDRDGFHVVDLVTNAEYHLPNPGMLGVLGRAREWTDRETLARVGVEEFGMPAGRADDLLDSMVESGFLVEPDSEAVALAREADEWREDGWESAFEFLVTIRDYPYYREHDYESAMSRVSRRAERGEVPPVYKRYEDAPRQVLPPVEEADPLPSVSSVLGGGEADGGAPSEGDGAGAATLDATTLSALLYYTFGETGRQELPGVGEFLLKTSPSGGGRHPIEAYVAVRDVDGLDPGLYHYAVDGHALERLGGRADRRAFLDGLGEEVGGGRDAGGGPTAVVACTAVVARNMWKYRDPRAYRIPYHDLGHLLETLRLCASARGVPVRSGVDLDADAIAELLEIERLAELPLGYAVVGRQAEEV